MFHRLRKILPSQLLLNIYKSYVQSKIDFGLYIWGCTAEVNLIRIQRIQNLLARIICNNFDYINFRGIEMTQAVPYGISYSHAWRNLYRQLISNVITDFYMIEDFLSFWCLRVNVLYFIWNLVMLERYNVRISTSHIYFYPAFIFIASFMWGSFIYDLHLCVYICVIFCMYILFCNMASCKNNLAEWSTLYKYIWNKKR